MTGPMASRLTVLGLVAAGLLTAEPRLVIALERAGDAEVRRLVLGGEVLGRALGLVISWSGTGRPVMR